MGTCPHLGIDTSWMLTQNGKFYSFSTHGVVSVAIIYYSHPVQTISNTDQGLKIRFLDNSETGT